MYRRDIIEPIVSAEYTRCDIPRGRWSVRLGTASVWISNLHRGHVRNIRHTTADLPLSRPMPINKIRSALKERIDVFSSNQPVPQIQGHQGREDHSFPDLSRRQSRDSGQDQQAQTFGHTGQGAAHRAWIRNMMANEITI